MSKPGRRTEDEETTVGTEHRKTQDGRTAGDGAVTPDDLLDTSPFDGDLATELAARPPRRVRPGPTMYLGAGVLVVVGFLGGVQAQKQWGPKPAAASADAIRQALASRFGGQAGQAGQNGQNAGQGAQNPGQGGQRRQGGGAGLGNVTFGTVKLVDGKTIYVQTSTGGVVQVKTDGSTRIQVSKNATVKDLAPGSTVIVQGTPGKDGTVAATSVNEGGVPAGRGPFGEGGGGN
jgi:hypothetical protein